MPAGDEFSFSKFTTGRRAIFAAVLGCFLLLIIRFTPVEYNPSIAYLALLIVSAGCTHRAIISLATLFIAFTFIALFVAPTGLNKSSSDHSLPAYLWFNHSMIALSLVVEAGVLMLLRDTNAKLLTREDELDSERRQLQAVLKTLPFGVTVGNADLSQLKTNPAGEKLLGISKGAITDAQGWPVLWTLHHNGLELPIDQYPMFLAVREKQINPGTEYDLHFNDGRVTHLLIAAAPILDRNGNVTGGIGVFADITEQRKLRDQSDDRRRDAEASSVRKTRMLAALSHDIRNPVNAIGLLAELIYRDTLPFGENSDLIQSTNELRSTANSLAHMLSEMLDLARYDSGKFQIVLTEFSGQELIDEACTNYSILAREKHLKLICKDHGLRLRTDRAKLNRAIANLVGNAMKFTEQGEIRVETSVATDGRGRLAVTDTGPGIPPERIADVFDEFVQIQNPERDREKGTGLGLSICQRIVAALGGEISVQSELGKGSTFAILLPATTVMYAGAPVQAESTPALPH